MTLRRFLPVLIVLLALAGCGGDGDDAAAVEPIATTDVAVVDNEFEPAAITVDVGDTVTWTWEGSNPHDVVGDDFESEIQTSGSFEHTFSEAGDHEYVCTVHPGMEGRVVVR